MIAHECSVETDAQDGWFDANWLTFASQLALSVQEPSSFAVVTSLFWEAHDRPANCCSVFRTTAKSAMANDPREEITMFPQLVNLSAKMQESKRSLELLPCSETFKASKPLKTLFLNPPSFEKFDGVRAAAGPPHVKSNRTGTLSGLPIPPACLKGHVWSTLRLTTSRGGRSSLSLRITSSLCSSQALWAGMAIRGWPN